MAILMGRETPFDPLSAGFANRLAQRPSERQCGSAKSCHDPESVRAKMGIELARCWDADADGAVDC
jgi:hypothetical protein